MDRQDRRIGGAALRPERRQDHRHHLVVAFQHADQRRIEPAGGVIFGGRGEFVLEAERVQERAQPRVVVRAEALVRAERVGDAGQRLAEVLRQQVAVRHVVRHLAQPVHVVAERDQPRRQAGELGEGVAHPGGARDLAERADMRQAGRAVAGLEQRMALAGSRQAGCATLAASSNGQTFGTAVSLLRSVSAIRRKLETGGCPVNRDGSFCSAVYMPPELPPMPPPPPPSLPPPPVVGVANCGRRCTGDRTAGARKNSSKQDAVRTTAAHRISIRRRRHRHHRPPGSPRLHPARLRPLRRGAGWRRASRTTRAPGRQPIMTIDVPTSCSWRASPIPWPVYMGTYRPGIRIPALTNSWSSPTKVSCRD